MKIYSYARGFIAVACAFSFLSLNACAVLDALDPSSDDSDSDSVTYQADSESDDTSSETGSVGGTTGALTADDGTPISGAAVALSLSSDDSLALTRDNLRNENGRFIPLPQLTDDDGVTCDDISTVVDGTVLATDCTGSDGRYELTAADIPCGTPVTFTAIKGSFYVRLNLTLSCSDSDSDSEDRVVEVDDIELDDDCGLAESDDSSDDDTSDDSRDDDSDDTELSLVTSHPAYTTDDDSCSFDIPEIAVVTGAYDEIENVLAKLGYGYTDEYGQLDRSRDYDFDLVDGTGFGNSSDTVMSVSELLSDSDNLDDYDIVFINCGTSYESLMTDPDIMANLQEYVEDGGKLYVTDLSYDYIEQAFPDFMDFYGSLSGDSSNAEAMGAAEYGRSGISTEADVSNATMADWLDEVTVNDGDIETSDCWNLQESEINGRTGARNADGTITIGDFLSGWSMMRETYDDVSPASTVWISGSVLMTSGLVEDMPLTVTKDHGDGRILYSSYHTAHSCPTPGFWPQERVLQYLVFEL